MKNIRKIIVEGYTRRLGKAGVTAAKVARTVSVSLLRVGGDQAGAKQRYSVGIQVLQPFLRRKDAVTSNVSGDCTVMAPDSVDIRNLPKS